MQDGGPYHKGNPAASTYGKGRAETTHILVKAMEEGKNLERNLDELHGVWGAECHHSGSRNKRDLRWSVAHNYREPSYQPQGEMRGDAVGEVGGGHISVEGRDDTTRSEERASAFIVHSGEVSDEHRDSTRDSRAGTQLPASGQISKLGPHLSNWLFVPGLATCCDARTGNSQRRGRRFDPD